MVDKNEYRKTSLSFRVKLSRRDNRTRNISSAGRDHCALQLANEFHQADNSLGKEHGKKKKEFEKQM
jgi:hypothetical protein